ncbi:MAG: M28 family peptidase [Chitinophagales bacterium]|nr:M28 family peptidase [Chitinophagales bacterium]
MFRSALLFLLCTGVLSTNAQISETELKEHVYFLADDSLEGRLTGSKGEEIAYKYISNRFSEAGLSYYPSSESYLHNFKFRAGKKFGGENLLLINGRKIVLDEDYYPLVYSGDGIAVGRAAYLNHGLEKDYEGSQVEGQIAIIESALPKDIDPHTDEWQKASLRKRLELAEENGALAVIVINTMENERDPEKNYEMNIYPVGIPVVFLKDHAIQEEEIRKKPKVELATEMIQIYKSGNNVIGFIDNPSDKMVVIGAHYDHLGWGIEGSRYRGEDPMIHNGADDNASGVALLLDLIQEVKNKPLDYDYCFIAFSGEELGLYGSKSLFDESFLDTSIINYMLNMDMVGRLDYDERDLAVNGVGTSEVWIKQLEKSNTPDLKLTTKESGQGPSDHAPFYFNNIPVLHFFTGTHEDYHHPDDDAHKLNYPGMVEIGELILNLIEELDKKEKLKFIKTNDESSGAVPRFTVTLGVMPDYMFGGKGMRIDGVTKDKVASVAGLQKGDIVTRLGNQKVVDMMTYMEGLSQFRIGDSTKLQYERDGKTKEVEITFK